MLLASLTFLFGLAIGSLLIWLAIRTQLIKLTERLSGKESELDEIRRVRDAAIAETRDLREQFQVELTNRTAAETKAARVAELESETIALNETIGTLQGEIVNLTSALSRSETRSEEEKKASEEKLAWLNAAKQELGVQFENLANKIFDGKSQRFTQDSAVNLNTLLKPFGERIREFEKKVDEAYNSESRERFSLEKEIRRLADLNTQISQDAINLTNALKGQTRVQGELGQIILETVLEKSGLVKGREYVIQKSLTNEEGRRFRPDVIVYLPEDRQLVIDSKVNLPTYQDYCTLSDGPERELVLKKHVTAFRKHVAELDLRRYQDLYNLSSLDFVLMFVPFEGSFSIAIQGDDDLFNYAFERNIVIVTPFTLAATIRTIANIWRQEYQSRNAFQIAKQAGRLYDKFVAFVADLKDIGSKLYLAQESYDSARNKLISGRGNIVSRIEALKLLGARAKKKLPEEFVADAMEDESSVEAKPTLELTNSVSAKADSKEDDSMPLLNSTRAAGQG
jgi:DNA recombination protein RmuC